MGDIRHYKCSCGYNKDVSLGEGLNAIRINAVSRIFPDEAREISESLKKKENTYFSLGNTLALCRECKELKATAKLSFSINEGSEKTICLDTCDKCNNPMEIVDIDTVKCPKCGNVMDFEVTGNWD